MPMGNRQSITKKKASMAKVVHVVPYFFPHIGGMEMRAQELAERLAALGWMVEILTSSQSTYPHTEERRNLCVRYLKSFEIFHTPIIFSLPYALCKIPKDSMVLAETAVAYCPEVTALICKLRGIPYIARVPLDSPSWGRARGFLLSMYQRTLLKMVYRGASMTLVLTPDDVEIINQKYGVPRDRFVVIANPTNHTAVARPRASAHKPFKLLFVGRLAAQKNVYLLLRAVRYFVDTYQKPIQLDIVGDGEQASTIENIIHTHRLDSVVTMHGAKRGKELERFFQDGDAFVMTSTHESFPAVLVEAMSKALPIVASNITGVRTIVLDMDNGLLCDLTPESFATAFYKLLEQKELYARLSEGSLRSMNKYSWEKSIGAYSTLLGQISKRQRA